MMYGYGDLITLIADKTERDSDGYIVATETASEVYADIRSTKRSEYYQAMSAGVTLSQTFRISAHDYDGQRIVDYNGVRYHVERSYMLNQDQMELYCSEVRRKL